MKKNQKEIVSNEIIKTKHLTQIYQMGKIEVRALDDINLSINEGEFVSVIGASGSGKTTLLNMLGALARPTSGKIFIAGEEITKTPESQLYKIRRQKIGFIFQSYYLIPILTALENVLVPTLPTKSNRRSKKRAQELLEIVGLKDRMNHRPNELSGGQQQRVAIARSLIFDPDIILADEPTGNLDSQSGQEIIKLMQKLNREKNKTFVIVTHDTNLVKETNRSFNLKDGRLV